LQLARKSGLKSLRKAGLMLPTKARRFAWLLASRHVPLRDSEGGFLPALESTQLPSELASGHCSTSPIVKRSEMGLL
jgi:hypothetical protein